MSTQPLDTPTELGLPVGTWHADRRQSRVGFAVKTMWGLVTVRGGFGSFDGTLEIAPGSASAELTIDVASLDTGNAKRDEHLRSADFFDAEAHPHVVFEATAITPRDGGGLAIAGDLTVGRRKLRLQLPVEIVRRDQGRLRLSTETSVTREQAGMTWNKLGMIRGDARLTVELELTAGRDGSGVSTDDAVGVAR
jgi:polyisoprenoid-binding protein YceI